MSKRTTVEWLRLILLFGSMIFLLAISKPTLRAVVAGGTLVLLGEVIRIWAAGHLFKTQQLITSGPYRFTRNPLYLGRFLILSGLAVMASRPDGLNLIALLVGWILFFAYYMPRKERIEPARLLTIHGAPYAAYFKHVPALFPRLTPWGTDPSAWDVDRFKRNRELLTAVGLAALVAAFWLKAAASPTPLS